MPRTQRLLTMVTLLLPAVLYAQHAGDATTKKPATGKMTAAQKIQDAMSAAPAAISAHATILDWPDTPTGQPKQLRAGTNGWVCYPNSPGSSGSASIEDPMCLDKEWQGWVQALMSKATPKTTGTGVAYMLRGDKGASNTDPFADRPTPTNNWVVSPAHTMILFTDPKVLDAYSADPKNGGPWVMWKGTPYAHLMVPVSATRAATMPVVK